MRLILSKHLRAIFWYNIQVIISQQHSKKIQTAKPHDIVVVACDDAVLFVGVQVEAVTDGIVVAVAFCVYAKQSF